MHLINVRIAFQTILGLCWVAACVPDGRSQGLRITDADFPIEVSSAKPETSSAVAVSNGTPVGPSLVFNPSLNEAVTPAIRMPTTWIFGTLNPFPPKNVCPARFCVRPMMNCSNRH